jgi:acyl carrier protein
MNREEIERGVSECVASTLGNGAKAIRLEDRIITDLGADSLDLLDLIFQMEQRFQVRIAPRDIEQRARTALGSTPLEVDGVYTKEALGELRKALPEVPAEELAEGLTTAQLPHRFRVATMVNLVERLLEKKHE